MHKPEVKGLINEHRAADYLGVSVHAMRARRFKKMEPAWYRIGSSVRYGLADLDAFLSANKVGRNSEMKSIEERELVMFGETDLGNKNRLLARYGHNLRYCGLWQKWLVWDGKRWVKDESGKVERMAQKTAVGIRDEVTFITNEQQRGRRARHAASSESMARIKSMIELAKSDERVNAMPEQFDVQPMLLNTQNGTVDLRNGILRPHDPNNLLTRISPVVYDSVANAPEFIKFMRRITNCDNELLQYIQAVIGYVLTGSVKEKAIFILLGGGDNGKTTFVESIRHVMGDYAGQIPIDSLLKKNQYRNPKRHRPATRQTLRDVQ